ncbi:MAG: hypothetical protein LUP99_04685 [Methanomicrobiales archaeon]|nr:hypothetical protein [Methanomicrobiales archaeon]
MYQPRAELCDHADPTSYSTNRTPGQTETLTQFPIASPGSPEVFIISPAFDAGIPVGTVTIVVEVYNFHLVNPDGRKNMPGTGHLVYHRDVVPPVELGKPAFTVLGSYASTSNTA